MGANEIQNFTYDFTTSKFTWEYKADKSVYFKIYPSRIFVAIIPEAAELLNQDASVSFKLTSVAPTYGSASGWYRIKMFYVEGGGDLISPIVETYVPPPACLLEGTMVQLTKSQQPIETLQIGDYVLNQHKQPVKITKIYKQTHKYDPNHVASTIYKIPKGLFGATSDVYLTHHHKFLAFTKMIKTGEFGLRKPKPEEFCTNNTYTVYHLRLEDEYNNHFIVNGGCVVEDWREWMPKTKQ